MNDAKFLTILNSVTQQHQLKLAVLSKNKPPSSEAVLAWATCLEQCIKQGIELSDPRWQRVTISSSKEFTTFALEEGVDEVDDGEFRIGLQLLMGMMGEYEDGKQS